jgi:hypothetical protein
MRTQAVFRIPEQLNRSIDEVDRMLASGNLDLVLDFSSCRFITVDGLEWLEELLLRASSLSAIVRLENVAPAQYKVFKVARIDNVLKACGGLAPAGPVC